MIFLNQTKDKQCSCISSRAIKIVHSTSDTDNKKLVRVCTKESRWLPHFSLKNIPVYKIVTFIFLISLCQDVLILSFR